MQFSSAIALLPLLAAVSLAQAPPPPPGYPVNGHFNGHIHFQGPPPPFPGDQAPVSEVQKDAAVQTVETVPPPPPTVVSPQVATAESNSSDTDYYRKTSTRKGPRHTRIKTVTKANIQADASKSPVYVVDGNQMVPAPQGYQQQSTLQYVQGPGSQQQQQQQTYVAPQEQAPVYVPAQDQIQVIQSTGDGMSPKERKKLEKAQKKAAKKAKKAAKDAEKAQKKAEKTNTESLNRASLVQTNGYTATQQSNGFSSVIVFPNYPSIAPSNDAPAPRTDNLTPVNLIRSVGGNCLYIKDPKKSGKPYTLGGRPCDSTNLNDVYRYAIGIKYAVDGASYLTARVPGVAEELCAVKHHKKIELRPCGGNPTTIQFSVRNKKHRAFKVRGAESKDHFCLRITKSKAKFVTCPINRIQERVYQKSMTFNRFETLVNYGTI
ncbi:MAG: hypothetical protein DHS80DRAFT_30618 [Piptocephalis tieghemiana]|nr:MAG: hypothetical protein DHS80DRAFT_30618 [Piptocephalis tieghemiana]